MPYVSRRTLAALRNRAANCYDAYHQARRDEGAAVTNLGRVASQYDMLRRLVAEHIVATEHDGLAAYDARSAGIALAEVLDIAGVDLSLELGRLRKPGAAPLQFLDGGHVGPLSVRQLLALSEEARRSLAVQVEELQAANEELCREARARVEMPAEVTAS